MVQEIQTRGTPFSRLGAAAAQGLSEQLPKIFERKTLSQGLKNLGEKKGLTPFQQASELVTIPGVNEQLLNYLLPLLQQQQAKKEFSEANKKGSNAQAIELPEDIYGSMQSNVEQSLPSIETAVSQTIPDENVGVQEQTPIQTALSFVGPASQQDINQRATDLMSLNPNVYPTLDKALTQAESEDRRRIERQNAQIEQANRQKTIQEQIRKEFDEITATKLQKEGPSQFIDLTGDQKQAFLNQAYDKVVSGKMTPTQAANHYGTKALDFAKTKQNLRNIGAESFLSSTPSSNKNRIRTIRDTYKEFDRLEDFVNDLVDTQNLTRPYASYIAYPVKENKEINNYISKIKTGIPIQRLFKDIPKMESEAAEKISKNITPNDSLYSIALELDKKGLNSENILNTINQLYKNNLNQRQLRELETYKRQLPSLGDIYLFGFSGLDPLVEIE